MVDFILNEEQREYQKLARELAQKEFAPRAHQFDASGEFPEEQLGKAWESGLLNVQIPENLGGLALRYWDAAVITEELASGCSGIYGPAETNALAIAVLLAAADKNVQERYLSKFSEQNVFAALSLDFAASGESCALSAKKTGEGWRLDGQLRAVNNAGRADFFLVCAGDPASLFVVPGSSSGIAAGERIKVLGRRAMDVRRVEFRGVSVGSDNLLGTEYGASEILDRARPAMQVFLSAAMTGVARSAMEHASRYAKERHTFGKPIAQHQAVAFMIADMAKDIEAARMLTWQAAAALDAGADAAEQAALSCNFSQTMTMRVATDAVQVYGGYGYSHEYPVEKLMRDAKTYQLMAGGGVALSRQIGKTILCAKS